MKKRPSGLFYHSDATRLGANLIGRDGTGLLRQRVAVRLGGCLLLLVHGLEVDFGQVHGREAGACDHVGHVAAQVGIDDLGQAMPITPPIWSSGTLRISKMPACLASTRNTVLSWILVCTVAVTATS